MSEPPAAAARPAKDARRKGDGELDRACAGALAVLPRLGQPLLRRLLARESASRCWSEVRAGRAMALLEHAGVSPAERRRLQQAVDTWQRAVAADPRRLAAGWRAEGIFVTRLASPVCSPALARHPQAPAVLFATEGGYRSERAPRVSFVGTRSCTHYGQSVAAELARSLAASGVEVVSGLEAGIEASALAGALACGSGAWRPPVGIAPGGLRGVLANGGQLVRSLREVGAIRSEAPPEAAAERWRYFRRSLLLALAADVVVVVEAHHRSGALAVAELAGEAGVAVAAVPGSVRSPASAGTNALLSEGAHLVRGAEDVLSLLALSTAGCERSGNLGFDGSLGAAESGARRLEGASAAVHAALEDTPITLELVLLRSRLPLAEVAEALEGLIARGLARRSGGCYERSGAPASRPPDR